MSVFTTLRSVNVRRIPGVIAICCLLSTCLPAQLIFDDQFDRNMLGDFWDDNGGWTILDGKAYNGIDDDWTLLTTTESFTATTYILETEVSNLVGGYQRAYYLLFGQQDDSGQPGYVLRYDPLGGGSLVLGVATDNYLYPNQLDRKIMSLDPERAHRIRVAKYENGLIQVYVGDQNGFPDVPTLEAIDTTHPALSKVSWTTFTQSVGEEFFVEYIRAEVPDVQKTEPEKPADDALIAQIAVNSDEPYAIGKLTEGETFYTDRPYILTSVPSFLRGASFVKMANNDKRRTETDFLTTFLDERAIAYVAFDPRASVLPDWLSDWTKTDEIIGTTDPGSDYLEVYTKLVPFAVFGAAPYRLRTGGGLAAPAVGTNMNYIVAFVPYRNVRHEAEDANLSGARVAANHTGFSGTGFVDYINPADDYIEWVIDVPATSAYSVVARFANGSDGVRALEFSVNGEVRGTESFSPTGLWSNWAFRGFDKSVLLRAGTNRFRLRATGSSGPNVDFLELSPTSIYTPPGNTALATVDARASSWSEVRVPATVSVYPNPAVSSVNFQLAGEPGADSELRIFDLRGREVYRRLEAAPSDGGTALVRQRIEVGGWPAGTYVYRFRSGGQVVSGKWVKGG